MAVAGAAAGGGLFRGVRGGACRRAVLAAEPHAGRGGTGVYCAGRVGAILVKSRGCFFQRKALFLHGNYEERRNRLCMRLI